MPETNPLPRQLADCARCAELREAGSKTPPTAAASRALMTWGQHVLDDHDLQPPPHPRPDCSRCAHYARPAGRVPPEMWRTWKLAHYVRHDLGIVDDGHSALRLE